MTAKHKLLGIRQDLLDMATRFKNAERLSFKNNGTEETVAVCIQARHMEALVGVLKADAKSLAEIAGEM